MSSKPDLGVERHQFARSGHYQRVDLGDRGVKLGEGAIECCHEFDRDADLLAFEAQAIGDLARMEWLDPARRVDRNLDDFLRRMLGHLLDLDPAFGRADQGYPAGFAVDQEPQIQLASDVAAFLDIDALDLAPRRSGLVGDEIMAEQGPRRGGDILLGADNFNSPGLAAAAGMDLRLDHPNRPAEPPRYSDRLRGGIGDPAARHATPNFASSSFAWYSWIFIGSAQNLHRLDDIDQLADPGRRSVELRLFLAD